MRVLGINTGTSVDGVDFSLIEWDVDDFKNFKVIEDETYPFSKEIGRSIEKVICQQKASLEELSDLNFDYSRFIAQLVNSFRDRLKSKATQLKIKEQGQEKIIELIGVHGQTIFHGDRSTWQIGDGSIIANLTNVCTVSDFRPADMAVNGKGAPLISFLDQKLIQNDKDNVATLNIGGIANMTVMLAGKSVIAYDIGPGNTLIDHLMKKLFQKDFDEDGKTAAQGKVNEEFLNSLIRKTSYFSKAAPKTTGRELFNERYAERFLDLGNKENIVTSATYLTIYTISRELSLYPLSKVYISGGGSKNQFIVDELKKLNPLLDFRSHEELNINDRYKEAMLFSLLAFTSFHRMPNNVTSSTGADRQVILGKFSYV